MEKYMMSKSKKMIISALLLALFIILDRLITINTQFLAINLSLVPIMLAGMILGWKYALMIGALGDFIGAIFWPFGAYFPGFTISVRIIWLSLWLVFIRNAKQRKKIFLVKSNIK